jgi:hypothetical protein
MANPAEAADNRGINYDEAQVLPYTLPDPLVLANGQPVTDALTWNSKRRPELLQLFAEQMYGHSPARPGNLKFTVTAADKNALGGLATRKEVAASFDDLELTFLLYLPNAATQPVPAFVGVNFNGNHTINPDPGITIAEQWMWDGAANRDVLTQPAETTRGQFASRWQVPKLLARGYAVATVARAAIEPDYPTGWQHGVRGSFRQKAGQTEFAPNDWGAVAVWAWCLSRALDYLVTDPAIDAQRIAVTGHSRMGKAALWAGAQDERFALVIANDSGAGGAALARRWYGETTAVINRAFPHWFCDNFKQYSNHEDRLPFDQHELIALIAPRPVYVASAEEDRWADPRGEFLAAKNAEPVYKLFGKPGLGVEELPAVNHPVGETIGYHIRTGKHDVLEYDWDQFLNFADKHFQTPRPLSRAGSWAV